MLGRDYDTQVCSIARALEVVGERWSLLLLRSVFLGRHRFDELLDDLGITRSVLSARLKRLEEEGVLERRRYRERPERFEYHATDKGRALWPALHHLMRWGDTYYPEPGGAPRIIEHRDCGGHAEDDLICDRCGEPLELGALRARRGPGAPVA
jgi:DNA-binding HxlR family transcriptional regulator